MSYDLGPSSSNADPQTGEAQVNTPTVSPIADLTYQNYNGPIKSHAVRWWVVSLALIRANVNRNRPGFWLPVGIICLTYLIAGIIFYVGTSAANLATPGGASTTPSTTYSTLFFNTATFPLLTISVFITALTVGSASISADNRSNALLVYLSKPLTRLDYLVGKWMAIFLLLSVILLVPSLLLYIFIGSVYYSDGFFSANPTLILRVLLADLLQPAIHASVVLGISAWSKSARTTGAAFAAFYLISGVITTQTGENMKQTQVPEKVHQGVVIYYSGMDGVANALEQRLYGVDPADVSQHGFFGGRRKRKRKEPEQDPALAAQQASDEAAVNAIAAGADPLDNPDKHPPLAWMILFLALYIGAPVWAAYTKVRAVEVVRG